MARKFYNAFPYHFAVALGAVLRVASCDVEVFVNDTASIKCSPNGSRDIQWHFKTEFNYIYAGRKFYVRYKGRFRLEKDVTSRDYNLIITNVTLEDAGMYHCQDELSGQRISSSQLTVLYVNPVCSSNMPSDGFVGPNTCNLQRENMTFSCDVKFNGRPPHVIWRSANDSQKFCSSSCEVKLNRSICNLTFEADSSYDGSVFICDAITSSGRRFGCNSQMVKVWYLLADYETAEKEIKGNANCAVRSNLNVQYKWILEQNSKRMLLSANQAISFQQSGIHYCVVDYIIRNTKCSTLALKFTVDADIQGEQSILDTAIKLLSAACIVFLVFLVLVVLSFILKLRRKPPVDMSCPLTEKEKSAINNNRGTLLELIDTAGLIDRLKKYRVFDEEHLNKISSKSTSHEKNEALLEVLENGTLRSYWQTIQCLLVSNQSHAVEILETGGLSVQCLPVDIDENEPFNRDVYIVFSPEDKKIVDALITELKKNEINCYPTSLDPYKHAWIPNGINTSKKCLMLWPSKYVKEKWYKMERTAALWKVLRFGRDTLIIVKSNTKQKVPKGLKGFKEIVLNKKQLDNPTGLIADLVTEIRREPTGIMRFGLAAGYFYGYLNIILKDFRRRLTGDDSTEAYVSADCLPNTLKKLLIIVPESCICPSSLEIDGKIELHKVVKFKVDRAGKQRDFTNSLFKVKEGTEEYYFAGEFSESLSTLYDAYKEEFSEMTEEQLHDARNVFFYSLKTILNQPKYAAFKDQVKLVYWSDPASKNPKKVDLHKCLMEVIRKEINSEQTLDYPMYKRPRGKCLIIRPTTIHSEQDDVTMAEEKDIEILQKLFQDLYFDVEIYRDVDSNAINKALTKTKEIDHSSYDAFVCCILSRGKPGEIYTSDGNRMRILDIGEQFSDNQCPSLKGKPKMFFIQTFQPGESDPPQSDASRSASDFVAVIEPERARLLKDDANTSSPMSVDDSLLLPDFSDFLMSYSCRPISGDVGLVTGNDGYASCYISALDECLRKGNEIDLALSEVSKKVREELAAKAEFSGKDLSKWLPFHRVSATRRRIYL